MNKGGQERRRAGRPGFAGRDRTRQAARRQEPPAGLPPLVLCLRWRRGLRRGLRRGGGAPPSDARPALGKKAGPAAAAASSAASARPRSLPGRWACALLPPGPRGGHTHLAGAGAGGPPFRGGGEDAGTRARRERRRRARREEGGLRAERARAAVAAAAAPVTRGKSRPGPSVRQARGGGAGGPATSRHPRPDSRPRCPARARLAAAQRHRPHWRGRGWESHGGWGLGAGRGGGFRRHQADPDLLTTRRASSSQAHRQRGVMEGELGLESGSLDLRTPPPLDALPVICFLCPHTEICMFEYIVSKIFKILTLSSWVCWDSFTPKYPLPGHARRWISHTEMCEVSEG